MEKNGVMRGYDEPLEVSFSSTNGEGSFMCIDSGYYLDFLNAIGSILCDEQGDNYRRDVDELQKLLNNYESLFLEPKG